ncbi:MAG: hypothetical protein COA96_04025 [SAR86 cluster bacterium]|uniref:Alpha/beta hydrolase domain-containing protein n=1 Tax=SAR86 cluster bacterium TaxID=2030880 RepID=A0A2A5B6V9_9GAMM|nr:MAG: hypothetical protein COA96_04025 [SAR86 cluster bacterium]
MKIKNLINIAIILTAVGAHAQTINLEKIPGEPVISLGNYNLEELGYSVEEFFFEGDANAYKPSASLTNDGNWSVEIDSQAAYKSRLVVARPNDPDHFNGTVVVEWFNVSGGADGAPLWGMMHREIIRNGYAYVGVSTQKVGIEGDGYSIMGVSNPLKKINPERYGTLIHPGDAYSYDIYSAAGKLIKDYANNDLMGSLAPSKVIAIGESQSAVFLTTYINAIDPIEKIYDGFVVDSRFGTAASLGDSGMFNENPDLDAVKYRDNLRAPIINVITETDLLSTGLAPYFRARQEDSSQLRTWEVAGASHADTYIFIVNGSDSGTTPIQALAQMYNMTSIPQMQLSKPINSGPQHHLVVMSALYHLNEWMRHGVEPPRAMPIQLILSNDSGEMPAIDIDDNGNAKGGVRTPWVDTPTAILSGLGNEGSAIARLTGITEVFSEDKLLQLYPGGKEQYIAEFEAALIVAVEAGFILPADQEEMLQLANAMYPTF